MAGQEIEHGVMRHVIRLEVDHRLQHGEVRRMLAEIGTKADLAQLMAVEAVAADEERDLAGLAGGLGNHPGRAAPDLAVVEPDITLADAGGEVGQ